MDTPITQEEIVEFLLDTNLFGGLGAAELTAIIHILQVKGLRAGQVLFREGEVSDGWYVVCEGAVEVVKDGPFERTVIARLGPKQCFGEMSILDGSPRFASVRAATDASVFRFPSKEFRSLLAENNLAAFKLVHSMALVLIARQREMTLRLHELLAQTDGAIRDELAPLISAGAINQ